MTPEAYRCRWCSDPALVAGGLCQRHTEAEELRVEALRIEALIDLTRAEGDALVLRLLRIDARIAVLSGDLAGWRRLFPKRPPSSGHVPIGKRSPEDAERIRAKARERHHTRLADPAYRERTLADAREVRRRGRWRRRVAA